METCYKIIYIRVRDKNVNVSFLEKLIMKIFDFFGLNDTEMGRRIASTAYWYVKFNKDGIPLQEIGFNNNGNVVVKTPSHLNKYGYWGDSDMKLENFFDSSVFKIDKITLQEFDEVWDSFNDTNKNK